MVYHVKLNRVIELSGLKLAASRLSVLTSNLLADTAGRQSHILYMAMSCQPVRYLYATLLCECGCLLFECGGDDSTDFLSLALRIAIVSLADHVTNNFCDKL
ncbi:hypothetical protein J6590_006935 [Homalodisca vitripennis]|nr:hypothetical protein J6590_006935 [Homalodisca vitripennis]